MGIYLNKKRSLSDVEVGKFYCMLNYINNTSHVFYIEKKLHNMFFICYIDGIEGILYEDPKFYLYEYDLTPLEKVLL